MGELKLYVHGIILKYSGILSQIRQISNFVYHQFMSYFCHLGEQCMISPIGLTSFSGISTPLSSTLVCWTDDIVNSRKNTESYPAGQLLSLFPPNFCPLSTIQAPAAELLRG